MNLVDKTRLKICIGYAHSIGDEWNEERYDRMLKRHQKLTKAEQLDLEVYLEKFGVETGLPSLEKGLKEPLN